MSSIYYPFFLIEKSVHKHYKHQRNIILLSLFSKDILIPIRHIFCIGEDEFDILLKFEDLIKQNVLYYRLPENIENLTDYYKSIKSSIKGMPKKTIDYRIGVLNRIVNKPVCVYDPTIQQSYYSERLKDFLSEYLKSHTRLRKNCCYKLAEIANADIVTKEEFEQSIKKHKTDNIISDDLYKKLRNASNALYFCAGTSGSKLKVCKDSLFDVSNIDNCILNTIHNYDEIINDSYNPNSIEKALIDVGIIKSSDDLCKLTCNDIVKLRSTKWHDKFVTKYCRLSRTNRALDFIKGKKKIISNLKKLKGVIFSLFLSIITTIISYFFVKAFLANIIVTIVTFVMSEIITTVMQKFNLKIGFIDNILDKFLGIFMPDVLYLYKIFEAISRA